MKIAALWRYPVKSMQGETADDLDVTTAGVAGDRQWALVDPETGRVASAKNPRKWGDLLRFHARLVDADTAEISGPNGTVVRTDDPDVDRALSSALGTDVRLARTPPDAASYEMFFPAVEGAAPEAFIAATRTGDEEDGTMTAQGLAPLAPGTFVDVVPLHVITTATLERINADVRRFRPNVVIATGGAGYEENAWVGRTLTLGGVSASVIMPTMRCVMTTLAQPGLPRDRGVLQTLTRDNRADVGGGSMWACAGAYAVIAGVGAVRVGDPAGLA